jgi:hypothetical protein
VTASPCDHTPARSRAKGVAGGSEVALLVDERVDAILAVALAPEILEPLVLLFRVAGDCRASVGAPTERREISRPVQLVDVIVPRDLPEPASCTSSSSSTIGAQRAAHEVDFVGDAERADDHAEEVLGNLA